MRRMLLLAVCFVPLLSGCSLFQGGALGRKYVVFFGKDSAALDRPARAVIAEAANAAANNPSLNLLVEGYAGANGSLTADEALSARRGETVANALRSDGVAANRIQLYPRAPSNETPEVAARRVEIDFGS